MERNRLAEYAEIIKNENCLKILFYLYKYNPNIPPEKLSHELGISTETVTVCIDKLIGARVIFKSLDNAYTMTPFGRSAFKEFLGEETGQADNQ